jgi:Kef-type K+ transport system membrane component KefB
VEPAATLIALGALFLVGLAADAVGRRTRLPRVTMLLACGIAVGAPGLDLLPAGLGAWGEMLAIVALTMVAFLLGGSLTVRRLRAHGRAILSVSLAIVLATVAIVATGLLALGLDPGLALILGAIATATDPAATVDAVEQSGVEDGFTDTLKGVVAVDDAWGLLAFSLAAAVAMAWTGQGGASPLAAAGWEIGGAVLLGLAVGLPGAVLSGRISPGEPLQSEALGIVFLTAGAALALEVSYLIAAMTAGCVIANRARHHRRAFHEIEAVRWPFMILFFVLAGASLQPAALAALGVVGVAYAGLRVAGRLAGGWVGAALGGVPRRERAWFGPALMPQAGVAVGMGLVAAERFPQWGEVVLALTVGATVLFELIGPPATLWSVRRVARARAAQGAV